MSLADERAIRGSLGRCDVCHDEYRVTRRLPESAKELVTAAVQQWDAVRLTAHSVMYVVDRALRCATGTVDSGLCAVVGPAQVVAFVCFVGGLPRGAVSPPQRR